MTWNLQRWVYKSIPTWTYSQNSLAAAEAEFIHPPMEHLSNGIEDHPNQHKNSNMLYNETRHPVVRKSMETGATTWSEFPNGGKAIAGQKSRTMTVTVRDPSRKDLSKFIWNYKRVHQIHQFHQNIRVWLFFLCLVSDKPITLGFILQYKSS